MDQQKPPEFVIDVFTDSRSVREVVKGILHTIFFNRFFPTVSPLSRDVLDLTLPFIDDDDLEELIQSRALTLERQLEQERSAAAARPAAATTASPSSPLFSTFSAFVGSSSSPNPNPSQNQSPNPNQSPGIGFPAPTTAAAAALELGGTGGKGQINVQFFEKRRRKAWLSRGDEEVCWETWTIKVTVAEPRTERERARVRRAMEQTLLATVMQIVTLVNTNKDHIPPITTQGDNPFPYRINVESKETGWVARMRIY